MNDLSFKNIRSLALPAIISGITEPILSATDAAVVGNIPVNPTEALAAVGVVGSLLSTLIWILAQTRSAIATIVAQNLGAGKVKGLSGFPGQAIVFNVGLGLIVLIFTTLFVEEILNSLNTQGLVLQYSISYYNIRIWGFPLTLFVFGVFGVFRGLQNTFYPMIVAGSGAIINIVLDIVLVYGFGPIPEMGIEGAAWASLITQGLMALAVLILYTRKTTLTLKLGQAIHFEIKRLLGMTWHLIWRSLALNAVLIWAVREANAISPEAMAAHTIAINVWLFSAFFIDGFGAAGNLIGGKLLGAKRYFDLWLLTKKVNVYNLWVAGALMLVGGLTYLPLGRLFVQDPEVLPQFYGIFFIVVLIQPFNALAFTLDAIFKGLGEMAFLRNSLFIAAIFGFFPVIFITNSLHWGLNGIWWALWAWIVCRSVVLMIKFYKDYYPLAMAEQPKRN